jgi:hypothetical protein
MKTFDLLVTLLSGVMGFSLAEIEAFEGTLVGK